VHRGSKERELGANNKKTALVTGGAGFIGSHTVEALLASGWHVRVLDNFSSGHAENLPGNNPSLAVLEADVRDYSAVEAALTGVDACLHLAAQVSVTRSIEEPALSAQHNITGWLNVLQAARDKQIGRVVYASSVAVFGDSKHLPLTEATALAPISPYGLEKRVDEDYATLFRKLYGLSSLGLRYFNVFGPRQDASNPYAGVITRFASNLRQGLPLIVYGDGSQSRDFIFVKDVARVNAAALESAAEGVLNVGTGRSISLLELISALETITGEATTVNFEPARAGDIIHSYGDCSRIAHTLNFTPKWSIEEGLRELMLAVAVA